MKENKTYKTSILNGEKEEEVVGLDTHSFEYFKAMCDCWSKEDLQYRLWEICKEAIEKDEEIERLNNIIEEYKVNTIPTLEHNIDVLVDSEDRLNNIIKQLEEWLEKQYLDSGKCAGFARINNNYEDIKKYTRDFNLYQQCMEKLQELKEGK